MSELWVPKLCPCIIFWWLLLLAHRITNVKPVMHLSRELRNSQSLGGCRAMFIILSTATVRHLKSECSRKQDNISLSSNSIKKPDIPSENRMERVQGVWISLPVYWNFYHEYCLSLPSFQKKPRHNVLWTTQKLLHELLSHPCHRGSNLWEGGQQTDRSRNRQLSDFNPLML